MNTAQLKSYAPEARKAFIAAVSAQAARIGITAKETLPAEQQGDVLLIGGQAYPKAIAKPRKELIKRIELQGFESTMETAAYSWFNRFVAIRFMELRGYLDHGYRVLSAAEGQDRPEVLDHATDVDLPGLDHSQVVELKLDGTKDEELYQLLIKAQCNALHSTMPFLFEKIGDETELLLPDNLLHTDSLIRQLVEQVDEVAWQDIEIIGWLYQFYISEKKDQIIGKVVKSEDIPAATQLFTPNWIVKYMVQNSLGAQWLATYPDSALKEQMEYYIEHAEQTDEVETQLAAITPSSLNPEELTLIDPACGSGHILVEAYDLFKAIYLERGYRRRDVPQLIFEKNLFGLDIDERAAQLSGFALMMKGRADDRRLFDRGVTLNVMALVDSVGFEVVGMADGVALGDYGLEPGDLTRLKQLFEHATTFGSLIKVPTGLAEKLPAMKRLSEATSPDLFVTEALNRVGALVQQAELLAAQYAAVVANPPYMGSKYMAQRLKQHAKDNYPDSKKDLFACFIERGYTFGKENGRSSMITMQNWMFLASFQSMRERLLKEKSLTSMLHLGPRAFGSISGEVVQVTAFTLRNQAISENKPIFFRLVEGNSENKRSLLARRTNRFDSISQDRMRLIPGSPIAYWVSDNIASCFTALSSTGDEVNLKTGLTTGDNTIFQRLWYEVAVSNTSFSTTEISETLSNKEKWYPCHSGGRFRKWYGNNEIVVNWENNGEQIRTFGLDTGKLKSGVTNETYYFKSGITWSKINTSQFAARWRDSGFLFDNTGRSGFTEELSTSLLALGIFCSRPASEFLTLLCPTISFTNGELAKIPFVQPEGNGWTDRIHILIANARIDWNSFERSWDFQALPFLATLARPAPTIELSFSEWVARNHDLVAEVKRLEEENNRLLIDAYGLQDELTPDVPIEQITLTVNPAYRYGGKLTKEEQWIRFRQDSMQELVSYAFGCMMGRYSLDAPGLIYAHSGNEDFDHSKYTTFPADDDGIVPLTDTDWFGDDACKRLVEFISVAWDGELLEENLTFLAGNLSPKKNESSRDTIRRYICTKFFKDHLKTYKRRSIYWLFTSGKQKAFQGLVYLHRYNEGTLSRMRSEYVIPLQGKMAARIEKLAGDVSAATSTAHRKRLEKEKAKLEKQQVELLAFDEKLRHYADKRISLDLDDGVKVNYGKFGDLLAEVKAVHGKKPEGV